MAIRLKSFFPFLISAILSAVSMLLADYNFNLIQDPPPNEVHWLKLFLLVPGLAFPYAIFNQYSSHFKFRDLLLFLPVLMLLWLFTFVIGYNFLAMITVPLSGLIGAFCLWWFLSEKYSIPFTFKGWGVSLAGLGATLLGFWLFMLAEQILDLQYVYEEFIYAMTAASVVFFWQVGMGLVFSFEKDPTEFQGKIEQIGT